MHLLLETKNMTLTFWYLSRSKHLSVVLHRKVQETFSECIKKCSISTNSAARINWHKKKSKSLAAPRRHLILLKKTLWLLTSCKKRKLSLALDNTHRANPAVLKKPHSPKRANAQSSALSETSGRHWKTQGAHHPELKWNYHAPEGRADGLCPR